MEKKAVLVEQNRCPHGGGQAATPGGLSHVHSSCRVRPQASATSAPLAIGTLWPH